MGILIMASVNISILIALTLVVAISCAETSTTKVYKGTDSKGNSWISLNWVDEPNPQWPTTPCATGKRQSPINLPSRFDKTISTKPIIKFISQSIPSTALTLKVVHQESYMADLPKDAHIMVEKNGIKYKYNALQFHIHTLSEHQFMGVNADFELHIVHKKDTEWLKAQGTTTDPDAENTLLVVGIMIQGTATSDNANWAKLNLPKGPSDATFNVGGYIPIKTPFYHYLGSLTTPGCMEVVNWNVVNQVEYISPAQAAVLKAWLEGGIRQNSRKVQALNGRTIYYQNYNINVNSSASYIKFGALSIFALIAMMF